MHTPQARATLLATREAQANVAITVTGSVAQAYFQLRAFDAQLEVTNRTVGALQESQRLTDVLFQGAVLVALVQLYQALGGGWFRNTLAAT